MCRIEAGVQAVFWHDGLLHSKVVTSEMDSVKNEVEISTSLREAETCVMLGLTMAHAGQG